MFYDRVNKYKKALLIGTGGGNDIVSTLIPAQHLQKRGIQTDIAGILSPGAVHTFNDEIEQVVNRIEDYVERFVPAKKDIPISFMDEKLPEFVKNSGLKVSNMYDFSIRYGTKKFVEEINKLVETNGYDLVVAVDVGGDILGRGEEDSFLLSPMMDFTSLYLLDNLNIDSLLIEFGLGTDGELRPAGMEEILNELREDNLMLHESDLYIDDSEIINFEKIFTDVKKIRSGHTAVMTLESLRFRDQTIKSEYRFRSQINKQKWFSPFEVVLPQEYAGKTYLIDGTSLAQKRETAFSYENSLEQYVKLKSMCPRWKTEMDMFYLWSGDNWTTPNKGGQSLFLLVPSTNISKYQRDEMLQYGIEHANTDMILMFNQDLLYVNTNLCNAIAGDYVLLSKKDDNTFRKTVEQIKSYQ